MDINRQKSHYHLNKMQKKLRQKSTYIHDKVLNRIELEGIHLTEIKVYVTNIHSQHLQ